MRYSQVSTGRIFIARIDHGDDLLDELKKLMLREKVDLATVSFLGALERADIVAGPESLDLPARPNRLGFSDGREVLGVGTMVREGEEVKLHLHGAFGKGEKALVGCLRGNCAAFITVEALITELKGVDVARRKDATGHEVLDFT